MYSQACRGLLRSPRPGSSHPHACLGEHLIDGFTTGEPDECSSKPTCNSLCFPSSTRTDSPTSESNVTGPLPSQPLATSSSFGSGTPVLPFSGAEFDEDFNNWRSELLDVPISVVGLHSLSSVAILNPHTGIR